MHTHTTEQLYGQPANTFTPLFFALVSGFGFCLLYGSRFHLCLPRILPVVQCSIPETLQGVVDQHKVDFFVCDKAECMLKLKFYGSQGR